MRWTCKINSTFIKFIFICFNNVIGTCPSLCSVQSYEAMKLHQNRVTIKTIVETMKFSVDGKLKILGPTKVPTSSSTPPTATTTTLLTNTSMANWMLRCRQKWSTFKRQFFCTFFFDNLFFSCFVVGYSALSTHFVPDHDQCEIHLSDQAGWVTHEHPSDAHHSSPTSFILPFVLPLRIIWTKPFGERCCIRQIRIHKLKKKTKKYLK